MSDDELDDDTGDEELDGDIDDDDLEIDDDIEIDDDLDDDDALDEDIDEDIDEGAVTTSKRTSTDTADEDEDDTDGLDLDEELHPDDVEAPLDALLQERTAKATLEDEEEEVEDDEADADDRAEGPTRIVPRRPGEFLCSSCFLVLPRHQLADEERMLCRDCA